MRLVAVFVENRDYEHGGYMLNFGGNFYYDLKFGDGTTRISRRRNENYINNFFDHNNTVTNVSAIVGNNGSGKTTTIYEVIKVLNKDFKPGFAFWENGDICFLNNYNLNIPGIVLVGDWEYELKQTNKQVGTIYYSPYLDHKISSAGIDISADRYLREDLVNIDSTYDANIKVVISERLKRADYKRYINFQKSKYAKKVIEEYGLLNDDLYRVVFIRHEIKKNDSEKPDFEETPWHFRRFLTRLFIDIQNENKSLNRSASTDNERFEMQKKLFKNLILMDLFCLLISLMEKNSFYLNEGHFNNEEESNEILKSKESAEKKLKYWLNNYHYSRGVKHPLPSKEVIEILNYLNNYLDGLVYSKDHFLYMDWTRKAIYFDEDKLFELLNLNESLLVALPKYYLAIEDENQKIYDSISELQHFISPEFAERRLSSGETAMLNLYSRLYDYFSRHILDIQLVKKNNYYLLFLDEADLGYHPAWKKSFVNTIINFSKEFFKELDAHVQIVFTTHDAISLSDIPNTNVIYLHSDSPTRILSSNSQLRPKATFAANVNDILGHSFFLNDLLVGEFANSKIEHVIKWINENREKEKDYNTDEYMDIKKTINMIEEPVLRNKLAEMLSDIEVDDEFIENIIQKQSEYLKDILKRRKK